MLGKKRNEIILGCMPVTLKLIVPLQLNSRRVELDLCGGNSELAY